MKQFSIFLLLFLSINNLSFCQESEHSLMEKIVLYVDSLLESQQLKIVDNQKDVVFSKKGKLLLVSDNYFRGKNIKNNYNSQNHDIKLIDTIPITDHYKTLRLSEYEMTHMSNRYFDPVDRIVIFFDNIIERDTVGYFIICGIKYYQYKKYTEGKSNRSIYSIVLNIYFDEDRVTGHKTNRFFD